MYFSEPYTDFRAKLYTDDGENVEVDFNLGNSNWRVTVEPGISREGLRSLVQHLHGQFYLGENDYLADWMALVDAANLNERTVLTLKTVDRMGG